MGVQPQQVQQIVYQQPMQPQYIGQPQQYVPVQPIQPMNGQQIVYQQPMQPQVPKNGGMNGNVPPPQAYQQPQQGYIQPPAQQQQQQPHNTPGDPPHQPEEPPSGGDGLDDSEARFAALKNGL